MNDAKATVEVGIICSSCSCECFVFIILQIAFLAQYDLEGLQSCP